MTYSHSDNVITLLGADQDIQPILEGTEAKFWKCPPPSWINTCLVELVGLRKVLNLFLDYFLNIVIIENTLSENLRLYSTYYIYLQKPSSTLSAVSAMWYQSQMIPAVVNRYRDLLHIDKGLWWMCNKSWEYIFIDSSRAHSIEGSIAMGL